MSEEKSGSFLNKPRKHMEQENFLYQPSGKIGPLAWVIFAIEALLVLPFISILYSLLIWYIPIIYLNILVVVAFGIVMGVGTYPIVRFGKVRGKSKELMFGALLWVFGMYFQWAAYITILFGLDDNSHALDPGSFSFSNFTFLLLHPGELWAFITDLSTFGAWEISGGTVKGTMLWVIWILEAGILLAGALVSPRGWSKLPFSEHSNQWYTRHKLPQRLVLHRGVAKFEEGIKNQDLSELGAAPRVDSAAAEYTELVVFEAPEEQDAYLAFYMRWMETDNKGNKNYKYERIGEFYHLTPEMHQALRVGFA